MAIPTTKHMIPITKPYFSEEELQGVQAALESGWVTQGPRVAEFETVFKSTIGAEYVVAVSNCTAAMHLSLLASGVKPGDVVLTVSHSFIATANAIRMAGAEPIFVDIDLADYNMSVADLSACLEKSFEKRGDHYFFKNTKELFKKQSPLTHLNNSFKGADKALGRLSAILAVHQMGFPCDIEGILRLAEVYQVPVVEDAACAIGSTVDVNGSSSYVGLPHGDFACFSFHPRKNLTMGDGGVITAKRQSDYDFFIKARHHGMSVSDLDRHETNEVVFESYEFSGFNYRLTDLQAAVGLVQLGKLDEIVKRRTYIAKRYQEAFRKLPWVQVAEWRTNVSPNWQSYPLRLNQNAKVKQREFMERMLAHHVQTRRGIMNSHQETPYLGNHRPLTQSEIARDQTILLPIYPGMSEDDIEQVVEAVYASH